MLLVIELTHHRAKIFRLEFGAVVLFWGLLIMVAGTMFLMWIGDQITERGVGNGVSLIISVNIIHALPGAVRRHHGLSRMEHAAAHHPRVRDRV